MNTLRILVKRVEELKRQGFIIGGIGYKEHYKKLEKQDKRMLTQEEKKIIYENNILESY